jgi:VanZ family protein
LLVGLLLVGATALLELTQVFEPSRHGRWLDLGVKVVGGVVGLAIGAMLARLKPAAR